MAISLIARPQVVSPAYNALKYIYDSTNNAEPGFRYIFDIYQAGTANKIAEYRPFPNIDGYGEQDLSRLLRNYVSHDFDPTNITSFAATNSYYKYDVKVGEMFIETIAYTNSLTASGLNVQINVANTYAIGDQITIAQTDLGVANPNLEGLFTVLSVTATTIVVNSLWAEVTDATIDGSVQYADKRKTITRDIVTVTNPFVFNGAIPFAEWVAYVDTSIILTANTDVFLTTVPLDFKMVLTQDMWVHIYNKTIATGFMYFENSTGDIFKKAVTSAGFSTMVSVGANNFGSLTLVSGSGALIEDDVDSYEYWYTNAAGTRHSIKYKITLDRRCKISTYEIAFLDRMGSMPSFAFQLRETLTGTVSKNVYNQKIEGAVTSQEWGYSDHEQGMKVVDPRIDQTYEMHTNYMDEDDARLFSELISSPYTVIKLSSDPVSGVGSYYSCIVQDTGYKIDHAINKRLIKKVIRVKLSVQDVVNG